MKAGIVAITVWLGVGVAAGLAGEAATAVTSTTTSQAVSRDKLLDLNQAANDSGLLSMPKFDPRNIPLLGKILSDPKEGEDNHWKAAGVLGLWRDPRAVDLLLGIVNNPKMDGHTQIAAIAALGDIQYDTPAVIDALLKKLEDPDLEEAPARALGKIGNPKALEPMVKQLQDSKSDQALKAMIESLQLLGDKRAIPSLMAVLTNEKNDIDVRVNAAEALGMLRAKEAVKPIIALLRSKDASIRYRVTVALGHIADEQVAEAMVGVLGDHGDVECHVDVKAENVLYIMGWSAAKALEAGMRSKDSVIAKKSGEILGSLKNPCLTLQQNMDKCIADLDDKEKKVREDANVWLITYTGQNLEDAAKWKAWWKQNRETWEDPYRPHLPRIDKNMEIVSDPMDAIRKTLPKGVVILKVVRENARSEIDQYYLLPQPTLAIYVGLPLAENPIENGKPWYQGVIRICPSGAGAGDDEIPMALANVSNGYIIYHGSADLGKLLKDAVIRKRPQSATATASAPALAPAR